MPKQQIPEGVKDAVIFMAFALFVWKMLSSLAAAYFEGAR
jgi:hypothetical protein